MDEVLSGEYRPSVDERLATMTTALEGLFGRITHWGDAWSHPTVRPFMEAAQRALQDEHQHALRAAGCTCRRPRPSGTDHKRCTGCGTFVADVFGSCAP